MKYKATPNELYASLDNVWCVRLQGILRRHTPHAFEEQAQET